MSSVTGLSSALPEEPPSLSRSRTRGVAAARWSFFSVPSSSAPRVSSRPRPCRWVSTSFRSRSPDHRWIPTTRNGSPPDCGTFGRYSLPAGAGHGRGRDGDAPSPPRRGGLPWLSCEWAFAFVGGRRYCLAPPDWLGRHGVNDQTTRGCGTGCGGGDRGLVRAWPVRSLRRYAAASILIWAAVLAGLAARSNSVAAPWTARRRSGASVLRASRCSASCRSTGRAIRAGRSRRPSGPRSTWAFSRSAPARPACGGAERVAGRADGRTRGGLSDRPVRIPAAREPRERRNDIPGAAGRLSYPVGYWNGLAALLATATVLLAYAGGWALARRGHPDRRDGADPSRGPGDVADGFPGGGAGRPGGPGARCAGRSVA